MRFEKENEKNVSFFLLSLQSKEGLAFTNHLKMGTEISVYGMAKRKEI